MPMSSGNNAQQCSIDNKFTIPHNINSQFILKVRKLKEVFL